MQFNLAFMITETIGAPMDKATFQKVLENLSRRRACLKNNLLGNNGAS